jgi:hypothetical protein
MAFVIGGCKPNLDESLSIVGDPIVLAVRSDPAEAAPISATGASSTVQLTALYVDRNGPIAQAPISWAFCNARNPLANLGAVNPECLQVSGSWFQPIGVGVSVNGPLPEIGCQQFGPLVPQPQPGQPQGRPVDPDPTGGYYQPARLIVPSDGGDLTGISDTRLSCGSGLATGTVGVEYASRYHANANPAVASLSLVEGSSTAPPWTMDSIGNGSTTGDAGDGGTGSEGGAAGSTNTVEAGTHVTLRAAWAPCPTTDVCGDGFCGPDETFKECPSDCTKPVGCTGAERFAEFDIGPQTVVDARESMIVSWFATSGSFDNDSTGRDSTDTTPSSDNGWTAPQAAGTVHLWVVLRDDRGGSGWGEYTIQVP